MIEIQKSETADTRTCDFTKVTKQTKVYWIGQSKKVAPEFSFVSVVSFVFNKLISKLSLYHGHEFGCECITFLSFHGL